MGNKTYSQQTVLRFELLGSVKSFINQGETGALSTTEESTESVWNNDVRSSLENLSDGFANFGLAKTLTVGMSDLNNLREFTY